MVREIFEIELHASVIKEKPNRMKNTKGRTFVSPPRNLDGCFFCFLLADTNLFLLVKAKHALCLKKEETKKNFASSVFLD